MRMEGGLITLNEEPHHAIMKHLQPTSTTPQLYHDLPPEQFSSSISSMNNPFSVALTSLTSRLGIALPNPAPDVEMTPSQMQTDQMQVVAPAPGSSHIPEMTMSSSTAPSTEAPAGPHEPKKKKYAKEAWPGKKPLPSLLV